jgi:hypothetical protein
LSSHTKLSQVRGAPKDQTEEEYALWWGRQSSWRDRTRQALVASEYGDFSAYVAKLGSFALAESSKTKVNC